jgi:glutaconate CoA-transferase subunit B
MPEDATVGEVMAGVISHAVKDGEVAIIGASSALPFLGLRLAQLTHAPNLTVIAGGSGAVNPAPKAIPASSCDMSLLDADAVIPLSEVIDYEGKTEIDVFFAGGLQIDATGACNLIGVGPYPNLKLRGPGTVGLAFLSRARRVVLYTTAHTKRTFVPKVDHVSGRGRTALVVTPLATMDLQGGRMRLASVHPGVSPHDVAENTGFEFLWEDVPVTPAPTSEEIAIMRELDPEGIARLAVTR